MQPAGVAQVDQKSHHHRLAALPGEKADLLLFAFVVDAKVFLIQIGDEFALLVGHRNRHDDFVDLYLDGWRLRLIGGRWRLCAQSESEKDAQDRTEVHRWNLSRL